MLAVLQNLRRKFERVVMWLTTLGAIIVLVQMVWISYGVAMRYLFDSPDGMVTEATALMLFPVAFAGLAFALKEDAYPKVTFLVDALPPKITRFMDMISLAVMTAIGGFFSIAAISATIRSYESGAASEILLWPRFIFWAPVALMLVVFTLYSLLRLALIAAGDKSSTPEFDASHSPDY